MNAFILFAFFGGICLLIGIAYPVAAILFYSLYKLFGGGQTLGEILREL